MKFKVFDKEKKEFVKERYEKQFTLSTKGKLLWLNGSSPGMMSDNFTPIFSTEQKDIEGNEIYEGDRVLGSWPCNKEIIATLDNLPKYSTYSDGKVDTGPIKIKYEILGSSLEEGDLKYKISKHVRTRMKDKGFLLKDIIETAKNGKKKNSELSNQITISFNNSTLVVDEKEQEIVGIY